jgi:hypothetical protein
MFCVEAARLPHAESRVKRKGAGTRGPDLEVEEVEAHGELKIPPQKV